MTKDPIPMSILWARLRLSIIAPLLANPPPDGHLTGAISTLAGQAYVDPITGQRRTFEFSTLERWYYHAKDQLDPLRALARKVHSHAGTHPTVSPLLGQIIREQYQQHPSWSYQLHHDNLLALQKQSPQPQKVPSYPTVRRYFQDNGLIRQKVVRKGRRGQKTQDQTFENQPVPGSVAREKRSFEVTYVHQLWHFDFHKGRRRVLTAKGVWATPMLLGILDDCSRLCCHLQWYLDEGSETLCHGLSQALAKRGRPRMIMSDNGAAMVAAETVEGLERLGILYTNTLPKTPEQNGKQENFWAQVEGRLMAMLEGHAELTLTLLNEATQAWVECEYNRSLHSELKQSPMARALQGPTLVRPSPSSEEMRRAFRTEVTRTVRRSDGTFTYGGVRFELPSRYRTLLRVHLRVARWDLSCVELVDSKTGIHLCTVLPLDKAQNADRRRNPITPWPSTAAQTETQDAGIAPLLKSLMEEYAATGLPPAYLPKEETDLDSEATPEQA